MTNSELNSQIEMALLESPAVAQVLDVRSATMPSGEPLIGCRVSILGATSADDILPVVASLRSRLRDLAPRSEIFIEIDPTVTRSHALPTEAIVIRSMD